MDLQKGKSINDETRVNLVFPNQSDKPIVQTWRVSTLKAIPYFRALFEGNWEEFSIDGKIEITMEMKASVFSKLLDYARFKTRAEEMESAADYLGVILPKNHVYQARFQDAKSVKEDFYTRVSFSRETSEDVLVDLESLATAKQVLDVRVVPNCPRVSKNLHYGLRFKLEGKEIPVTSDSSYGTKGDTHIILNTHLRKYGKIDVLTASMDFSNIPAEIDVVSFDIYMQFISGAY